MTVPMTTVASSEANCLTVSPTSWNSPIDRSTPAVTFTSTPLAPDKLMSSSSGLEMAASAAMRARSWPLATPEPIIAMPISDITVRTSAKSTLMRPGRVMSSAIPCTAPCSTSFADRNASSSVVVGPSTDSSFSFGIVISESTNRPSSAMPCSATRMRFGPSMLNGFVTTATVRMPISFASCATTGAAPVPVPPPKPAVMNSMSAPSMTSRMRSRSSIAAWRPTSGLAPAPRPFVMLQPICRPVFTLAHLSACASVFAQMKSTPSIPARTMCATALPPPPPIPSTLMTAVWLYPSISSNIVRFSSSRVIREALEILLKPRLHAFVGVTDTEFGRSRLCFGLLRLFAVEQQPDSRRMNRVAHDVRETFDELRHAQAHRHVEHFFRELDGAFHLRAAAREHDAGGHELLEARAAQLFANELEQLLVARLDDLRQCLAREPARWPVADARHLDRLVGVRELRQRAGVLDLDLLGVRQRHAQRHGDVVRHLVARDRDHG